MPNFLNLFSPVSLKHRKVKNKKNDQKNFRNIQI